MILFVDESERARELRLAAVAKTSTAARPTAASALRSLLLPNQTRLHMVSERPARRREILRTLDRAALTGWVFHGATGTIRNQRDTLLQLLATSAVEAGASSLVLDYMDDAERRRDRVTLANVLRKQFVSYGHAPGPASTEPMLWAADAVAWAAGHPTLSHELPAWVRFVSP